MKKRTKKYLVFMFGGWETVEKSRKIITNIREVMQSIVVDDEFSFVTGTNIVIMCVKSKMSFEEISELMDEFLTPQVNTYFLMPKPNNLAYRMDKELESHLFHDGLGRNIKHKLIDPKLAEELSNSLKALVEKKMLDLRNTLKSPIETVGIKLRMPFTVDSLLDKIIEEGMESLTHEELEFLNKFKDN
jgi:hypothetical protein|tara:strand:- start:1628 stop:2191 length:564 start_codon:yes stop_codon:yes gene_type:complete